MTQIKTTSEITVNKVMQCGTDAHLAAAAWVSTSEQEGLKRACVAPDDVTGVLNYLLKHKHGTPFEHGFLTMYVHAPIFVWREWHRHRIGFSYNEESARYKILDPVFYVPPRDRPMVKVDDWKPGRPKFLTLDQWIKDQNFAFPPEDIKHYADERYATIIKDMTEGYQQDYDRYRRQLDRWLDPGLARDNLSVGIYSSCWVSCNPRSLMAFLSLRTHDKTANHISYPLYEIEVAAKKVEELLKHHWPVTHAAFNMNGREAP